MCRSWSALQRVMLTEVLWKRRWRGRRSSVNRFLWSSFPLLMNPVSRLIRKSLLWLKESDVVFLGDYLVQVNEGVREKENSDRLEWIQSHVNCDGPVEVLRFTVFPSWSFVWKHWNVVLNFLAFYSIWSLIPLPTVWAPENCSTAARWVSLQVLILAGRMGHNGWWNLKLNGSNPRK